MCECNNTNNNRRIGIEINENLINFEPAMANQALKLPLKEVAKLLQQVVNILHSVNILKN